MCILSIEELEDKKRITDDIDWWKKEYKKEGFDKILIHPKPKFTKEDIVSLDLHIGDEFNYPVNPETRKIPKDGIFLDSGETINVITKEYIGLPRNVFGLVFPKLSCTIQGLPHIATRVDPGFHGKLVETISNLDRTKIKIKPGDLFCSIIFFEVKPSKIYEGRFLNQENLNKVKESLIELYDEKKVNPTHNPITNKKDVIKIATKTLSTIAFVTLLGLYGIFIGTTTGQHGVTVAGASVLGYTVYYLLSDLRK